MAKKRKGWGGRRPGSGRKTAAATDAAPTVLQVVAALSALTRIPKTAILEFIIERRRRGRRG